MEITTELSLEQQFTLQKLSNSIEELGNSPENWGQLKHMLIETSRMLMIKDNVIKGLLREQIKQINIKKTET